MRETFDPPAEGINLVSLVRGEELLRATWVHYRSSSFLSLRIWTPRKDGSGYVPTKRGATVRKHELRDVRDAIDSAIQLAERESLEHESR
ncbi:MAG: hypothetical protein AB1689_26690 [Thermodesulfobacteriota bacterium]